MHDPGQVLLDLVPAVALGGDCLSDVAAPRADSALFGPVASDPTVSRLVDTLPGVGTRALTAIRRARAEVRERVWTLAGTHAPDGSGEPVAGLLRPGNAGSNTTADHITTTQMTLAQLPKSRTRPEPWQPHRLAWSATAPGAPNWSAMSRRAGRRVCD
jgi:hypothetical protein